MHDAFYSTCAQVIPVILLALTLSEGFLLADVVGARAAEVEEMPRRVRRKLAVHHARMMYFVVAYLLLAELAALAALLKGEMDTAEHAPLAALVVVGIAVGIGAVFVVIAERIRQAVGLVGPGPSDRIRAVLASSPRSCGGGGASVPGPSSPHGARSRTRLRRARTRSSAGRAVPRPSPVPTRV
jgi:hypothetical protein